MSLLLDPRAGDAEDDASSTKARSLTAIAGSLLAEISPIKLAIAWLTMVALPGLMLGLAPLVITAWVKNVSAGIAALAGLGSLFVLALPVLAAWYGFRPLFRAAEQSFWALNAVAVQPGYALIREALRHLGRGRIGPDASVTAQTRFGALTALGAGLLAALFALGAMILAWPASRWIGTVSDLATPFALITPAIANTVILTSGYFAAASLVWAVADATMDQPRDLAAFDLAPDGAQQWRVAHLSDVHVVGERYGFRIESGRAGPRGNERFQAALAALVEADRRERLDLVLITGDMTDAGRSAEWAEFFAALRAHPTLLDRVFVLPGNHDVNIVDRANPARLDLPWSAGKRLRQVRALAAIAAVQGARVTVIDPATGRPGPTLDDALAPHRGVIRAFADEGSILRAHPVAAPWREAFPMVVPPPTPEGLGLILLDSNAESHFSFTNALGIVTAETATALRRTIEAHPTARWIVALHHHVVEYPRPAKALSERIGTALVNGSWFVREIAPYGRRIVVMHGHRHIDWIGACGALRIISAPSPVMEATGREPTSFLIHRFAAGDGGALALLAPERIQLAPEPPDPPALGAIAT
ncbi:MAG: metallophosphoesterase family protein [bacterium]